MLAEMVWLWVSVERGKPEEEQGLVGGLFVCRMPL